MAKKQGKSAGITVDLDCLRKAVVVCGGAIGKTGVLRCLRIESFKGSWGVTGSDGQLSVTYQWQGPTHPEWPDLVMLLDAAKLREIVDRVPCDTIDLTLDAGKVTLQTTAAKYVLPVVLGELAVPDTLHAPSAILHSTQLREGLRRCRPAIDQAGGARFALGGVHVALADGTLTFSATDTRRLHRQTAKTEYTHDGDCFSGVIPERAVALAERFLALDVDAPTEITMSERAVQIDHGVWSLTAPLLDGRFPSSDGVFHDPAAIRRQDDLSVSAFAQLLRQVQIVTSEESRGVDLAFGADELAATGSASDIGECRITLPLATQDDAPPVTITADPGYVRDALSVLTPEGSVRVCLIDGDAALQLQAGDFSALIMPMSSNR